MVDISPVRIKAQIALSDFTHIVFLASREVPPATIDELIAETRRTYEGPLEVGEGLMCLEIGETITVHKMTGRPH
jgi:ribonuclease Z